MKNKLYRLAYLWVKDREIAEDLLQAVFEKAWRREKELQQVDNPIGWMVRSLKNESLQHHRSFRKHISLEDKEIPSQDVEPAADEEKVNLVFHFLKSLPQKQQEVFHLREVEGLTYEEISDYLEISIDQVKVSLHRARKTLREYLTKANHGR